MTIYLNMLSSFMEHGIRSNMKGSLVVTPEFCWDCCLNANFHQQLMKSYDLTHGLCHRSIFRLFPRSRSILFFLSLDQDLFLLFHETKFPPTNTQYPELDLQSSLDLPNLRQKSTQFCYAHDYCIKYHVPGLISSNIESIQQLLNGRPLERTCTDLQH